jgi:SDR family mycofactocin-dependent oxidoreductase
MAALAGRVAFITGAARGQGRSHAVRLAEDGADIVALDICTQLDHVTYPMSTPEDLDETVRLVEKTGRRCLAVQGDVRELADVQGAVQAGLDAFGRLDVVCANAGIVLSNPDEAVPDRSATFKLGLDVMLVGVWNTIQASYPTLVEQGDGGSIICTSSTAGIMCLTSGSGGDDAYTSAKLAVTGLVKAYAGFLAPHNIRVNAVAPTGVATPMITQNPGLFKMIETYPQMQGAMHNALPVELLEPSDVTDTVLFLASPAARYYTGQTFVLDAGAMLFG